MAQSEPLIAQGQPTPTARTGTDSGGAAEASSPVIVRAPEPGERIEIEVTSKIALRIAVDFTDAHAELVDGKIEVTLPNGSVLVLYGEAVDQFLAGYGEALEAVLAPAAGWTEVQRILTPIDSVAPPRRDDVEEEEDRSNEESDAAGSLRNDRVDDLPASGERDRHRRRARAGFHDPERRADQSRPGRHPAIPTASTKIRRWSSACPAYSRTTLMWMAIRSPPALVSGPAHGTLTFNGDGSFIYNPDADYSGGDSFKYKVSDGAGHFSSAVVQITVVAVDDAPTLKIDPASGNEDSAIALDVETALSDLDGSETLTVLIGAIPVGATLSDGTNSFTATSGNTSVDVSLWTLSALTVTPPADSGADFTLAVTAISTETSNGDEATIKGDLSVSVSAIADAPALAVADASGDEDAAIALSIDPSLTDTDGSELLSLEISAIPLGATLSDGTNSFTATSGNTTADITGWTLSSLAITPPADSDADFTLTIIATSIEAENNDLAVRTAELAVTVAAIADAPTLEIEDVTGNQDAAIALSIDPALVDGDGSETLSVVVGGIPLGATLSDGANSFTATAGDTSVDVSAWSFPALTITPPAGDASDFTLSLTVTSTEGGNGDAATTKADLQVTVLPPLFTDGDDTIDFSAITKGTYIADSQYDALDGNDTVALPTDAAAATAAGFDLTKAFHGGDGDDSIVGSKLGDALYGDDGDDTIRGGAGADPLDGGAGTDTVDYSAATGGVTINLATGAVTGGDGTDSISGFEVVIGSAFADTITNAASGTIDLGGGSDSVTLAAGGGTVTLSNVETVTGGAGADSVTLATAYHRLHQPQWRRRQPDALLHRRQHHHGLQYRDGDGRHPGRQNHIRHRRHLRRRRPWRRQRHGHLGERHQQRHRFRR